MPGRRHEDSGAVVPYVMAFPANLLKTAPLEALLELVQQRAEILIGTIMRDAERFRNGR